MPKRTSGQKYAKDVQESQFVAAYIEKSNATDAYLTIYPLVARTTAHAKGKAFLKRTAVQQELTERQDEIKSLAVAKGLYTLEKANEEICDRIERASREGQHSAVAAMLREKLKLHKLVDSRESVAQAGISFTIHNPDGTKTVVNADTLQPVGGEADSQDAEFTEHDVEKQTGIFE